MTEKVRKCHIAWASEIAMYLHWSWVDNAQKVKIGKIAIRCYIKCVRWLNDVRNSLGHHILVWWTRMSKMGSRSCTAVRERVDKTQKLGAQVL